MRKLLILSSLTMMLLAACAPPQQEIVQEETGPNFGTDLQFLKEHAEVVTLSDPSGEAVVAIVPKWQGRVMTSTCSGAAGPSFGWINYDLIKSGVIQPHINVFGGEDRFWMGPEGGQFSIFFKGNDAFDLEHWQTPAFIDTDPYEIVAQSEDSVSFKYHAMFQNYSGTEFHVDINRQVRLLSPSKAQELLQLPATKEVKFVAFESDNRITNAGQKEWTKESGLLSIWILGMYIPSPKTTVVIPYQAGGEEELGPIVNDAYFGKVPEDRLKMTADHVFFKADGEYRSKIGLSPQRSKPVLGSWDAEHKVLTIVQYSLEAGVSDYVNSMWEIQDEPFKGDTVNSYNDGPPAPGAKPLGPFYELETSSPAAALAPGATLSHVHRTFHFVGSEQELNQISTQLLGSSLQEIEGAL